MENLQLTEEQQAAVDVICEYMEANQTKGGEFGLFGPAGSGKTTVVREVIRRLQMRTCVCAFTNKAKKVIYNKVKGVWGVVEAHTLHSLFGLQIRDDGQVHRDFSKRPSFLTYQIVVIDECSMIDDNMDCFIRTELAGKLILFVGDNCQLPPVQQQHESLTFEVENQIHLKRVMRFGHTTELGLNAEAIRARILCNDFAPISSHRTRSSNLGNLLTTSDLGWWHEQIFEKFLSKEYTQSDDYAKVLALNNDVVHAYNQVIRRAIYGTVAPKYAAGERLIANGPIVEWNEEFGKAEIQADSSDIVKVLFSSGPVIQVEVEAMEIAEVYRVYEVSIEYEGLEGVCRREGHILADQENREKLIRHLHKVKKRILNNKEPRPAWREYYKLRDGSFYNLDYCYALTLHKSQGSTYQHVFLHESNLEEPRNLVFTNANLWKAKYVAITRPAQTLTVYNRFQS